MNKSIWIKVFRTIILSILIVGLYFVTTEYKYFKHYWVSWRNRPPSKRQMRKYYKNLPEPTLTAQQVVGEMVKQKGLLNDDFNLIKMAQWYVYHGNKDVITQLITNLQNEVKLSLPEDRGKGIGIYREDTIGESYHILKNQWELLKHVSPILHDELHKAARFQADAHLIWFLMDLISCNDPSICKPETKYVDIHKDEGPYLDIDWYTEELVKEDILAYLRIYVNYKDWPTIKEDAYAILFHYPGDWLASVKIKDAFRKADEEGVEAAYDLVLKNLQTPVSTK